LSVPCDLTRRGPRQHGSSLHIFPEKLQRTAFLAIHIFCIATIVTVFFFGVDIVKMVIETGQTSEAAFIRCGLSTEPFGWKYSDDSGILGNSLASPNSKADQTIRYLFRSREARFIMLTTLCILGGLLLLLNVPMFVLMWPQPSSSSGRLRSRLSLSSQPRCSEASTSSP